MQSRTSNFLHTASFSSPLRPNFSRTLCLLSFTVRWCKLEGMSYVWIWGQLWSWWWSCLALFLEFGPIINLSTASLHHGFEHASSPRGGTNERCPQSLPGRPPHKYTSSKGTKSKEDYTYQFIRACPHILGVEYRFICGAGLKSGLRSRILAFLTVWGSSEGKRPNRGQILPELVGKGGSWCKQWLCINIMMLIPCMYVHT